jgi:hypothetical protein
VESNPNTKIPADLYELLQAEFGKDKEIKEQSQGHRGTAAPRARNHLQAAPVPPPKPKAPVKRRTTATGGPEIPAPAPEASGTPATPAAPAEPEVIKARAEKTAGPKTVGKIDLDAPKKKPPSERAKKAAESRRRRDRHKDPAPSAEVPVRSLRHPLHLHSP